MKTWVLVINKFSFHSFKFYFLKIFILNSYHYLLLNVHYVIRGPFSFNFPYISYSSRSISLFSA